MALFGSTQERGPWGVVVWNIPGRKVNPSGRYQITDADALAMAAMAVGEGDVFESMQTIGQRWAHLHATPRYQRSFPTLKAMVHAYNQPMNPDFLEGGKRCPVPDGGDCSPHRLARRKRLQEATTFDELRRSEKGAAARVDAALKWLRGQETSSKVPGAVHFAVHGRMRGRSDIARIVHRSASQSFGTVNLTDRWTGDEVVVAPSGGLVPGTGNKVAAVGVGLVIGLGVATVIANLIEARRA